MQRVLVVRIGRLGDTILATPVIEALQQARRAVPEAPHREAHV